MRVMVFVCVFSISAVAATAGVYYGENKAWSGCTTRHATVVLRNMLNDERAMSFLDYVDRWFDFYRSNHDPQQGPPNKKLDVKRYPAESRSSDLP